MVVPGLYSAGAVLAGPDYNGRIGVGQAIAHEVFNPLAEEVRAANARFSDVAVAKSEG
jgi:ribosomal protein S5